MSLSRQFDFAITVAPTKGDAFMFEPLPDPPNENDEDEHDEKTPVETPRKRRLPHANGVPETPAVEELQAENKEELDSSSS